MKITEATELARYLLRVQPDENGTILDYHNVGGVSEVISTLRKSRKSIQQELATQLETRLVGYFERRNS